MPTASQTSAAVAWTLVAGCATIALLRVVCHDANYTLIWLNSFTAYIYLPVYVCLVWAIWRRRWILATLSILTAVGHVVWVAPDFLPNTASVRDVHTPPGSISRQFRIYYANVYYRNPHYDAVFEEIRRSEPDIMVLVEFDQGWSDAWSASSLARAYPYSEKTPNSDSRTVVVYSRLPITDVREGAYPSERTTSLSVDVGGPPLRIVALHAPRPTGHPWTSYRDFWSRVAAGLNGETPPLVVVGDFNLTQHSRIYRSLTDKQLRSAHEDRGRGYATSWPREEHWLPPIRIDHILLSPQVECLQVEEWECPGSDHASLVVDLQVRDPPTPPSQGATALEIGKSDSTFNHESIHED